MKQLQYPPPRRAWWKRADTFLLLLSALVVLLGVRLYESDGEPGLLVPVAPYAETGKAYADSGKISRREVDAMPTSGEPVRFLMLNTENYFVAGETQRSRYVTKPKPIAQREAVADVIASVQPEIVGLVEVGGPLALADLQQRLAARKLHYEYSLVLLRGGEDRALALLSMLPIAQNASHANYGLYGQQKRRMLRGILDVTLRAPDGRLFRVLGAHLKSRVGEDAAAAESLRQREAQTLAYYIEQKTREYPNLPIVVFGDWNDNPQDASVRLLEQGVSEASSLYRLKPRDSRGEEWTLYYRRGNTFNTFDHIFLNKAMKKRLKQKPVSGVVDIPAARTASDHRAVWCELR